MARSSVPVLSSMFLLILLLVATEMGPRIMVAEGRTCESQSHRFKGTCVRESNCASVCQTEGFPDGHCRGLTRRCYCSKPC